jgi:hypothetical protein
MTARYLGGGPPVGTFDFTPAFYDVNCSRHDIPAALKQQCSRLDAAVRSHGYGRRINCFGTPGERKCQSVMASAKEAQNEDERKREQCLQMGEARYNQQQTDPRQRRANDCNYSELRLGGSNGKKWRLLLPAACRPGTYVDQFGLDCCSGNLRLAASLHPECTAFFPFR